MPLVAGTRLGAYEIIAPLGSGGMGEVYRARDTRLGREIALKVLPSEVSMHPDRLARFEREARTVAALNHPNIVVIHSIEAAEGTRFLTMEMVEGQSLDHVVAVGGLSLAKVLDLAIPLADALVAAHEKGIVHRDLKPANVMVTREGRVKVLDFGLAKLVQDDTDEKATQVKTMESPISKLGQVVGTVPYMAPEQIRGEPVDARSDLFSFGVLVYELASGKRPFGGTSSADISSSILRDTPPTLRSLRAELPRDLERIVGRCLEKDRERRFQTAKDVRNELEIVRREMTPAPVSSADMTAAKPQAVSGAPSIAVLPFANRSRDEEDEYFSDGLADELLSVLVKVRGLRVAARTSSAMFKGKAVTIAEVGHALNVATVLEGSVRKSGNRVRISVQLVKVDDGYPLWSETYDRSLDDIFAVQDDIARSVVKELRTTLLGESSDSQASGEAKAAVAVAVQGRGENAEAHRLYLQGKYHIDRFTNEGMAKGIEYLKQAVDLDPTHAAAWVMLARAFALQGAYGWMPVVDGYRQAQEAVNRAIALSPEFAEAHVMQCNIRRAYDWDWKGALASAQRALELAPGNPEVLTEVGVLYMNLRRFDESVDLLAKAVEQDPLSSRGYSQLGYAYRVMDRLEESKAAYQKSLELSPTRITAHHMLAWIAASGGRDSEAMQEVNQEPADWARLTGLAFVHYKAGRRGESDQALETLKAIHALDSAFQISAIHAVRAEADAAFTWMERGYALRDSGFTLVFCEPAFRPIYNDPRWPVFLKKMGFID
jgi:serine/threonine protein kinase/tetratricopeptide (TPR) repeat protein